MNRLGKRALRALKWGFVWGFIGLVAAWAALTVFSRARPAPSPHPFFRSEPRNYAHGGGARLAPEETLVAFATAREAGADVLELNLHRSADGELVVLHDRTVDRTTDGSGAVAEMTLAELRALNAGHRFPGPDGDWPYRESPVGIPTLDEVFAAHPDIPIVAEMKVPETALPLCRAIEAAGRRESVLVAAFSTGALDAFRKACPGVATGAGMSEAAVFLALSVLRLPGLHRPPPDALFLSEAFGSLRVVTPTLLAAARRAGLPVVVWTVNEEADMVRLLDLGVSGILTDDPATLERVLASRR